MKGKIELIADNKIIAFSNIITDQQNEFLLSSLIPKKDNYINRILLGLYTGDKTVLESSDVYLLGAETGNFTFTDKSINNGVIVLTIKFYEKLIKGSISFNEMLIVSENEVFSLAHAFTVNKEVKTIAPNNQVSIVWRIIK